MSQFCEKCGARRGATKFCTECGASLSDDATQTSSPVIIDTVTQPPAPASTQKISAAPIHAAPKQKLTDHPQFKLWVLGGLGALVMAVVIAGVATFLKPTGIIDGEIKLPAELAQERAAEAQKIQEANALAAAKEEEALRVAQEALMTKEAAKTEESLKAHEELVEEPPAVEQAVVKPPAVEPAAAIQTAEKAVKAPSPPPVAAVKPIRVLPDRIQQTPPRDQEVLKQTNKTLDDLLK